MDDWQQTYDPRDLNYLSAKAKQIADTAAVLRVPALGLVGGIAREMTRARTLDPYDPFAVIATPIKEALTSNEPDANLPDGSMTWRPITHESLATGFARCRARFPRRRRARALWRSAISSPARPTSPILGRREILPARRVLRAECRGQGRPPDTTQVLFG